MQTTQKRPEEDIKVRRPAGPLHFIDASALATPWAGTREPEAQLQQAIGLAPFAAPFAAPSYATLAGGQVVWPQQAQAAFASRAGAPAIAFQAFPQPQAIVPQPQAQPAQRVPLCDIVDEGGEYVCQVELPGVKRENVDVSCFERALLVTAHAEPDIDVGALVLAERGHTASYRRAINLPGEVQPGGVKAALRDGILTVNLPKTRPTEGPKRIPVS